MKFITLDPGVLMNGIALGFSLLILSTIAFYQLNPDKAPKQEPETHSETNLHLNF